MNDKEKQLIIKLADRANWTDDFLNSLVYEGAFKTDHFTDSLMNMLAAVGLQDEFTAALVSHDLVGKLGSKAGSDAKRGTIKQENFLDAPLLIPELVSMSQIEEKDVHWLIPNYIPKGQITILAGDGGTGKTSTMCNIVSSISNGTSSILTDREPDLLKAEKGTVVIFSAEDSLESVLKGKLRRNHADESNVLALSIDDDSFKDIKFNSPVLEGVIEKYRPSLIVFDPLQAFLPDKVDMGKRNQMRNCLAPLIGWGQKYDVTSLIICHTNKRVETNARGKISDSADVWDIARSVLMVGRTNEKNVSYISQEKSNYGCLEDSVLFSIDKNGVVSFQGTSTNRFADFQREANKEASQRIGSGQQIARNLIIEHLKQNGGTYPDKDMKAMLIGFGVSESAYRKAKSYLKEQKQIKIYALGFGEKKVFHLKLVEGETSEKSTQGDDKTSSS